MTTNRAGGWAPHVKDKKFFIGHSSAVKSLAFSRDGKILASGGETIKLLDISAGSEIRSFGHLQRQTSRLRKWLDASKANVTSIAFSPKGNVLASASQSGAIKLWDINTGKEIYNLYSSSAIAVDTTAFNAAKILQTHALDSPIKINFHLASTIVG